MQCASRDKSIDFVSEVEQWLNMEASERDVSEAEDASLPVSACVTPGEGHDREAVRKMLADRLERDMRFTPSELAGRYRFVRLLGAGSQGKVYLAKRLSDDRQVAIKQHLLDSVKTWKEYTMFHREAEVLSSLDVPGVVKLYEARDCFDANPPCSYIVQEYVNGETLKTLLASGYRFSRDGAYDLVLQIIDILEKLHAHDPPVIHRDIKPSNIILKKGSRDRFEVCLIDFGAVSNPKVQSGGSTVAGTFGYMSPEQMIGRATPASDTYALAALFAYILSGVDPAEMRVQDLRLVIDPYVENHPPALVQTLRRMLEPDIRKRLSDLSEIRRRFTLFKEGRYVLEEDNCRCFSKEEFIDRFRQVRHLCQPQNLEIWQDLPDLPRNRDIFPIDIYTNPRFLNYPCKKNVSDIEKSEKTKGKQGAKVKKFNHLHFLWIVMGILIYWHVMVAMVFVLNLKIEAIFEMNLGIAISSIFMFIIFGLISLGKHIIQQIASNRRSHQSGRIPEILSDSHVEREVCDNHIALIRNGIKTIATITCIRYIPSGHVHGYRVEAPPKFRIYYKFNPPDDDDARDLEHFVDTHRDPEGLFKVGDPLPILYSGVMHKGQQLHVTKSMPYPFPLNDMEWPTDYYWTSEQR